MDYWALALGHKGHNFFMTNFTHCTKQLVVLLHMKGQGHRESIKIPFVFLEQFLVSFILKWPGVHVLFKCILYLLKFMCIWSWIFNFIPLYGACHLGQLSYGRGLNDFF